MSNPIKTPDQARAELARLEAASAEAIEAAAAAAQAFTSTPSDKTAVAKLVADQRAANATAELRAAREAFERIFQAERDEKEAARRAEHRRHAAALGEQAWRQVDAVLAAEAALRDSMQELLRLVTDAQAHAGLAGEPRGHVPTLEALLDKLRQSFRGNALEVPRMAWPTYCDQQPAGGFLAAGGYESAVRVRMAELRQGTAS